jgi:ankyrin repeat protein
LGYTHLGPEPEPLRMWDTGYTQAGCWDAVRRLVAECRSDPDDADEQGCSLLMMAARSGLAEMVEMLIQHEATVDETDDEGLTALAYAASYGQVTKKSDAQVQRGRAPV